MKGSNMLGRLLSVLALFVIAAFSGVFHRQRDDLMRLLKQEQLKFNCSGGLSEDAAGSGMNATHNITQKQSVHEENYQKDEKQSGYSPKFQPDAAVNSLEENDDETFDLKFNSSGGLSEDAAGSGMNATHNITEKQSVHEEHYQKDEKQSGYSSKFQPDAAVNSLEENDDATFDLKFNSSDGLFEDAAGREMNVTHNITQKRSVHEEHYQKDAERSGYSSKFQPDVAVNSLEELDFILRFNSSDGLSEDTAGSGMNAAHNIVQKRSIRPKYYQKDGKQSGYSPKSQPNVTTENPVEEVVEEAFVCPSDYGYFPDPKGNCTEYYSCRDGIPEKRVCTNGTLHFNPITRLCDYSEFALCKLECPAHYGAFPVLGFCHKYLDCNGGEGRIVDCPPDQHFNAITRLCDNPIRAGCEVICPPYDTLLPLPGRCEMYASCKGGLATYHLCPRGLLFNPIKLHCDFPAHSGCTIQQQCYSSEGYFPILGQCGSFLECHNYHAEVRTCSSGLHFNFLLHTCDVPSNPECRLTCKEPDGFFPFPGVCAFYIMCVNGIPVLQKCPGELEFNEVIGQCDITPQNHCKNQCPKEDGAFPVPNHCGIFVHCSRGVPSLKRCSPNMHFNGLTGRCDTPERAKCVPECEYASGVFPFPGRCGMYYRCENYVPTVHTCIKGLHFNARSRVCDWPQSARCEMECPSLSGFYPIQGSCSSYLKCDHGRPKLLTCPNEEHFNYETKRCGAPDDSNCEPSCLNGDGMYPIAGHCDSYIHCLDGKPYITTCPEGLFFNRDIGVCDLPEYVTCSPNLW